MGHRVGIRASSVQKSFFIPSSRRGRRPSLLGTGGLSLTLVRVTGRTTLSFLPSQSTGSSFYSLDLIPHDYRLALFLPVSFLLELVALDSEQTQNMNAVTADSHDVIRTGGVPGGPTQGIKGGLGARLKASLSTITNHAVKHTGVGIVCAVAYFDP